MKYLNKSIINILKSFVVVTAFAMLTATYADDTEIFYTQNISNNLLFVLDSSGSMGEQVVTTTVVGGGTTSSGGSIVEIDKAIASNKDDATQTFDELQEASAGEQVVGEDYLEFQPDNIVATRFRFNGNSILAEGQRESWWKRYRGWRDAKITKTRIKSAYLKFFSASPDAGDTSIKITVEDAAHDYANFNYWSNDYKNYYYYHDTARNFFPKINERPLGLSKMWQPSAWGSSGTDTVDVTDLVQQVVDRNDWNSRASSYVNSFAFKFETESGKRVAYSYDGSSRYSPELHIEYEYDVKFKWSRRGSWQYRSHVDADTIWTYTKTTYDDAEQEWIDTSNSSIEFYEPQLALDEDHNVGLRFNLGQTIPKDAVILDAYITLTSAGNYTNDGSINIQTKSTGSAAEFSLANPILSDGYDSGVNWPLLGANWTLDTSYRTPELTQNIQSIVDNSDVDSLAFRLLREGDLRNVYALDGSGDKAPVLYIKYQDIGNATAGTGTGTGGTTIVTEINTRLEVMQKALENVLQVAPEINVGLMKYSGMNGDRFRDHNELKRNHYVGGIVYPISPIYEESADHIGSYQDRDNLPNPGDKIVREYLSDVANQWEPYGGTPIVDSLYEAALYFRGELAHFGRTKNDTDDWNSTGSHPSSLVNGDRMTKHVADVARPSQANARYKSPIINECQSSYIVLMSDGEPTNYYDDNWGRARGPFAQYVAGGHTNTGIEGDLATRIKSGNSSGCLTGNGEEGNTAEKFTSGTCGREITQFLATNDQMPDGGRGSNKGVKGEQLIKTFVIGFGPTTGGLSPGAEEYLKSLVTVDGNGYFKAEHKQQLETAFLSIFDEVAKASNSLSSPGYSVNVKSGLEHEDDIYIPVFDRKNTSRWSGNLKKFKLVDDNGKRKIRGKNNKDAFDEYGAFTDDALDYWSASPNAHPDGFVVDKGGVAELIEPENRKIFSDLDCDTGCDLNTTSNLFKATNSNVTAGLLGIDSAGLSEADTITFRKTLINFMRGWEDGYYNEDGSGSGANAKGIKRGYMGDMLHTEPLVVTYAKGAADGSGKKQYIFAATNEGYLHAFDVDSGKEKFVFAPEALLKNSFSLFNNAGTARDHKYGVDGTLTYWHDDANHDGNVDSSEKVYLYFGLRRGGRAYYALDVSNINQENPQVKLLWKKTNDDDGMGLLGQTWSAPYLAKVRTSDGTKKEAMIISGGYDQKDDRDDPLKPKFLDDATTTVTSDNREDAMGHNIYILDMHTGELLWDLDGSMSENSPLKNSIPGGVRILDVDRNGVIDRMYFADTGGFVWRLDLSEALSKSGDDKSKLTKLASLAVKDSRDARKFYNEPDVAVMSPNGKTMFAVSIGSGFRAHPQDKTIHDKFFVLKDVSPYDELASDFDAIEVDSLASVSVSGSAGSVALTQSGFGDANKDKGWYLSFPEDTGEKVLATAITVDGIIAFTSMVPKVVTDSVDVCKAPVSDGRLYALNILTGEAGFNLDESEESNVKDRITDNDAFVSIVRGEIPGKPQIVFNSVEKNSILDASGEATKTQCSHPIDIRNGKKLSQVTGYDACRLESVYWNDPEQE